MTRLVNRAEDFADEALAGFVAANRRYVAPVHGGVVRSTESPSGQVAIVVGGGTGHYPAFAGWVGPGIAHGAPCGNIFASPSASQVYSVARRADNGGGVLLGFGNYAGDVLHFGQAAEELRADGIDVRVVPVTDDVASADPADAIRRRGIAGDLPVFKIVGAAAEEGLDLDHVERVARKANAATFSLGVAFGGCTLPGADRPLFTVPEGTMALGLGIHGEPGIAAQPLPSAAELAELLVTRLLAERPEDSDGRVAVLLNGLGNVKYEELFVVYRSVAQLLSEAGLTVVDPEVGEHVTSLDMSGCSLTLVFLDDELERLWRAPADTPAFSRGAVAPRARRSPDSAREQAGEIIPGAPASQELAARIGQALQAVRATLQTEEARLGALDAVAGDGDHGIGMLRGIVAAHELSTALRDSGVGAGSLLVRAGEAWAEKAGGTSGALWGCALAALGRRLGDDAEPDGADVVAGITAGVDAIIQVGGARPGDKTLVDAAIPFVDELGRSFSETGSLAEAWNRAVAVCTRAAQDTADLTARIGRARVHGDNSLGSPDPGAVSFALVVEAAGRDLTCRVAGH